MAKLIEVEVVEGRGWNGGPYGDRFPGDRFGYEYYKDPHQLRKLGLVKLVKAGAGTGEGNGA